LGEHHFLNAELPSNNDNAEIFPHGSAPLFYRGEGWARQLVPDRQRGREERGAMDSGDFGEMTITAETHRSRQVHGLR
jgi:hypothetical protein